LGAYPEQPHGQVHIGLLDGQCLVKCLQKLSIFQRIFPERQAKDPPEFVYIVEAP
jgi:hypothetical protein